MPLSEIENNSASYPVWESLIVMDSYLYTITITIILLLYYGYRMANNNNIIITVNEHCQVSAKAKYITVNTNRHEGSRREGKKVGIGNMAWLGNNHHRINGIKWPT